MSDSLQEIRKQLEQEAGNGYGQQENTPAERTCQSKKTN